MNGLKTVVQWGCLLTSYVVVNSNSSFQKRSCYTKMSELCPPKTVKGMKKLDRTLFDQTISVPCLVVNTKAVVPLKSVFHPYTLKLRDLRPIRPLDDGESVEAKRQVLLNPDRVSSFTDIKPDHREKLKEFEVTESDFKTCSVRLTYDNWKADEVLKAVLPDGMDGATGYSLIGHIVHVNLKEHLLDYKTVIGEVLLEKVKPARTVVNKVDTIDNTFRVFNMEVLAGDHDFVTEVKENHLSFKFDFSSVYWNPRLATERQRIVDRLKPGNVLYDVFAGVGPFSIPAAKKKCFVLANDLNPESYKWLKHNAKINKVPDIFLKTFNKDGANFIKQEMKQHLLEVGGRATSHVVMNLPALAVTFLPAFKNLFTVEELASVKNLPLAHIYCFVKGEGDPQEMAKDLVESELNCSIGESLDEIMFIRKVAPNKDMMRVSFQLNENLILGRKRLLESEEAETLSKKHK